MTLKNEDEYRAALAEVSPYFDGPEPEQMPARVSELLHAIEAYEREFYPVPSLLCHGGAMNTGFLKMQHERFMQAAQKFDDGRFTREDLEKVAEEAREHTLFLKDGTDIQETLKRLPFGDLQMTLLQKAPTNARYIEAIEIINNHLKKLDRSR